MAIMLKNLEGRRYQKIEKCDDVHSFRYITRVLRTDAQTEMVKQHCVLHAMHADER